MADPETGPETPTARGWFGPDRIGGLAAIALGLVSIEEAVRLFHLRTGTLIGDHAMPAAVGILLVIFGLLLMLRADSNAFVEKFPKGAVLARLLGSFVILFAYWLLMDRLGYIASTFIVSIGLFKVMSEYGWFKCLLYSAITSAALGYLFMNLLNIPLPSGLISFG
ncbi:MAG TPA: tripartite tricarboxylate transporter TctB family protein [Arsenicitalea sp.]|jgi:putative tricarboxylic transport membrane protein|nr:tripartite tricarboxylate transporter TctB family protein [Arsenicitalea sp.]